jgi:radical SAM superfamily enzyme YgiQ (UPF0313 family)
LGLKLVDENVAPVTAAHWDWAQVVMLSGMIVQAQTLADIIRRAKARGKVVVAGGPGPTSLADRLLAAGCDFLVRGEAEGLMTTLVAALEAGQPGGVLEAPDKPDLRTSPIPSYNLLKLDAYDAMVMQTSRGCPHDCEFCDVVAIYGRRPRYKSPDQVMAELEAIYNLGWRREIFISDDNFIGHKGHARAILDRLTPWMKSHGEPFGFWTQASIKLGQDLDLINRMTEANFSSVFMGIESLDDQALKTAGKYQNVQHSVVDALNTIRDNGLDVVASFILGCDGEQAGAGARIARFVEATQVPMLMLNLMVPLPHTRLWQRLIEEGRLEPARSDVDWSRAASAADRLTYQPTRPAAEILAEYRQLWERLMEPTAYLNRAYHYYRMMRPTRAAQAKAPHPKTGVKPAQAKGWRRLLPFLKLSWRLGAAYSCRGVYWRHIFDLWRKNPSRLVRYLRIVGLGVDLFAQREKILRETRHLAK